MNPETINLLHHSSLTAAVNEQKNPRSFITNFLYGNRDPQPTEEIEIGVFQGAREVAPFVRKNGAALMVAGLDETFIKVEAPNIRIKRPLPPHDALFTRRPGESIFTTQADVVSSAEAHVARNLRRLNDMVTNATEYLCALSLRGSLSYTVDEEANFQITYPRSASHAFAESPLWDAAGGSPAGTALKVKRLFEEDVGLVPTDAILGKNAATEFLENAQVRLDLDVRRLSSGSVTLESQFNEQGALFLGRFAGINWWEYSAAVLVDGSSTSLIRDDYAEFVCNTPAAEFTLYYGAIPDWDALQGRRFVGERFSKSWMTQDPSALWMLVHSRPLPVPRRPDATCSVQVL